MKKNIVFLGIAAVLALLAAGCRQGSLPTVEGRVIDATIYSVTVLTARGDTVSVSTRGTDPLLVPGVLAGDEVQIACEPLPGGEALRAVQLDITAPSAYRLLPGIWRDCSGENEVALVLAEDGSAQAVGLQELTLQDWSLDGEDLVLTAVLPGKDKATQALHYRIGRLNADSLVVAPAAGGRTLSLSRQE